MRIARAVLPLFLIVLNGAAPADPPWFARLKAGYPDYVDRIAGDRLVLKDGSTLPISDGVVGKTEAQQIARPDLDDMFARTYLPGEQRRQPKRDPGRVRYEPFFDRIYGDCRTGAVQPNLRDVAWMPSRGGGVLQVTIVNGVADRLAAVVRDLEKLPPEMTRYLVPAAGTFNCRTIAGTDQRSMHAYAVAIDIALPHSNYWRWDGGEKAKYRNRIPLAIVEIFERHGFIWGGKWRHYDTMHFEYRPELLPPKDVL